MLKTLGLTSQQIKEISLFNIRKLENKYKTDEVKGNIFILSIQMTDMMRVVF